MAIMKVTDYQALGKLIKRWAKKEQPQPTTYEDFVDQCETANVGIEMPDFVKKIRVIQEDKDTFVLRLPPADLIKEAEANLENSESYPIPGFYDKRYHVALDVPKAEMKDFNDQRVGDYVIQLCV